MCGIVSIISKGRSGFTSDLVDSFRELLWADQVRGVHGTGIFYNSKKNVSKVKILKAACGATEFIRSKEYNNVSKVLFSDSNFVVGHNRYATKGEINAACTHPFREDNIILVHNGTLFNYDNLDKEKKSFSDSHAICKSMSKIGEKETIKKLDGSFALVWYNLKDETLNLCKNYSRPLHIVDFRECFIIASEPELAVWIGKRNKLVYTKQQEVTPKRLYKFPLDNMSVWNEQDVDFYSNNNFNNNSSWKENYYKGNKQLSVVPTNSHGAFAFGQRVRFRTELPIGKGNVLEGWLLKDQKTNYNIFFPGDYETESRVKLYILPADKEKFENCSDVEATIYQIYTAHGKTVYLTNSATISSTSKEAKRVEDKPTISGICEWCGGPIEPGTEALWGNDVICPTCNTLSERMCC